MEPFPGIPHEELLKLVVLLALLLGTARLFGELMRAVGQPPVVGEIAAGVLLGPVMSSLFPGVAEWVLPQTAFQSQLLDVVAFLGIMALIIVVGLETDLALIRMRLRPATAVGLGGLVIPFASGVAIGFLFPDDLAGDATTKLVFSLFLAVALALSAIPVLAKVLSDLGLMRSEFGQTSLAAGMIDDLLGWTLLGLVTSLAATGTISVVTVAVTIGAIAFFFLATLVIARPLVRWSLALVQDRFRLRDRLLTLVVVLALAWGAFSQALHLEPILGAFVIGILFGQSRRLPVEVGRQLESITYGVFAPIFLATAGLRLRLEIFTEPRLVILTVALLAVAATGKLTGCYLGARFAGIDNREALAFGVALNARGVLGIVVAAIGLSMGIFGVEVYSMVVVTSILTSVAAPMGLKWLLGEEIDSQALRASSKLDQIQRVLLPVRTGGDVDVGLRSFEVSVIESLAATPVVTLMTVVRPDEKRAASSQLTELARLLPEEFEVTRRVVVGDPARAIIEEAEQGYDLLALGASEPKEGTDHLFEPIIDEVIKLSPCPTLIFAARDSHWPPRRILVPAGGSPASVRAAELAYAISGPESQVLLLHVVDTEGASQMSAGMHNSPTVRLDIGQSIVDDLKQLAQGSGISVVSEVVMGLNPTTAIIDRARRDIDLIILGTRLHTGTTRLYLGPKVERLIREATCSIIIYNV